MMSTIVGTVAEIWRFPLKSMAGEMLDAATIGDDGIVGDRGWAVRDEGAGEIRGAKKIPKLMTCSARYLDEPATGRVPHVRIELPDGEAMTTDDPNAATRLSEYLGRKVSLWPRRPASDREHYRRAAPDNPDFETELRGIFGRKPDEPLPDLSVFPQELFEFTSPLGTYFDAFPFHVLTTASLQRLAELNPQAVFDRRRFRPNVLIATAPGANGFVETEWVGRTLEVGGAAFRCEIPTVRCSMTTHEQEGLPKDPSVLRTIVRDAAQNVGVYASIVRPGRIAMGDEARLL
jgi:uncharacterized protein YcbX